jgi:cytochrome c oxidase cbb3-type subunit IV
MTYQEVSALSGTAGLFIFLVLFAGAALYALWPGNSERFDRASRMPLEVDPYETHLGEQNGRK